MKISSSDRILIIAPHPDDELISSFKLMRDASAIGASLKIVFLTDGERNHLAHMRTEKKLFITAASKKKYGLIRRSEANAVLDRIGKIEREFWGIKDSLVTASLFSGELHRRFGLLLEKFAPTIVVAPSLAETHPDHSAAAAISKIMVSSMPKAIRPLLLYYSLHTGRRFHSEEFNVRFNLSSQERKEKLYLASLYQSQYSSIRRFLTRFSWGEYFSSASDPGGPRLMPVFSGGGLAWFKTNISARYRPVKITAFYCGDTACEHVDFRLDWSKVRVNPFGSNPIALPLPIRFQKFYGSSGGFIIVPDKNSSGLKLLGLKITRQPAYFDHTGIVEPAPPAIREPSTCIVIPCYNIEEFCSQVIESASRYGDMVIAVDDGSSDSTAQRLDELAATVDNVRIIKFEKNRGKGFALLAGMRTAIENTKCDLVITMDGDMQHRSIVHRIFQRLKKLLSKEESSS